MPASVSAQQDVSDADRAAGHYDIAVQMINGGRYREAVEEFGRAIEIAPEPVFYCNRAVALMRIREIGRAAADLRTCSDTFEGSDEERAQIDAQAHAVGLVASHMRARGRAVAQACTR